MRSVCPHDCPSACSLEVTTAGGRIIAVTGDAGHPFTRGVICGKVRAYAERVHSPLRLTQPLRRVGPKGAGRFEPVGWEAAIDEIAARWRAIAAAHGAEAILPFSYAGSMGQVQYYAGHPLFHALGASRLDRTICVATAYAGWRATVGAVTGNDSEQMVGADLVVLWGINAAYSTVNVMTLVKEARARGAYVVTLDPYRTPTARQADEHLMLRPGTDGALALAVMHVLVAEGRVDHAYLARATVGFDRLAEHVRAWSPARVAAITGLSEAAIVGFARRYGATRRSFIRVGIGLSRHDNGGMTCRTLACLPALTGAYADPHGGALLSSGGAANFDFGVVERPDLLAGRAPRVVNMIQLGRVLTDPTLAPPVKALYVYSSNPAAVCPNQALVLRGLAREDLFTVVHEQVMTDTAHYADLVLPATTSMEHEDLYRSYGQFYLQLAAPVLPPPGEARSNWEVCGMLARALGVAEAHYAGRADLRVPGRRGRDGGGDHLRAAAGRGLGAAEPAAPVPAVRGRRADGLGQGRALLRAPGRARAAAAAHVDAARRGARRRRPAGALPAAVHRAAQPLLPELVLQPVRAPARAPGTTDRDAGPRGRPGPRDRGRRRRPGGERARRRSLHRPGHRRHPPRRRRHRRPLVAPLPPRRPRRELPD
jgi:anaerobic selenocysteine-containing dehydrogenase